LNWLAHRITGVPFDGSKKDPCPVEKSYLPYQAKKFFQNYRQAGVKIDYLFGTGWGALSRIMPVPVHRALGKVIGWHLMIEATK
jgi:hypothetical protein